MPSADEFDREWKRLEKHGHCDGFGGGEYTRVRAEWEAAGRPTEVTIEAFIRRSANWVPGFES